LYTGGVATDSWWPRNDLRADSYAEAELSSIRDEVSYSLTRTVNSRSSTSKGGGCCCSCCPWDLGSSTHPPSLPTLPVRGLAGAANVGAINAGAAEVGGINTGAVEVGTIVVGASKAGAFKVGAAGTVLSAGLAGAGLGAPAPVKYLSSWLVGCGS
jgi:hypothetical protein